MGAAAGGRPGVRPDTPWSCPASHPIKGYVADQSRRHVYYLPGARFYEEASPERCYASEDEARRDGSRPADEIPVSRPGDGLVHRGAPSRQRVDLFSPSRLLHAAPATRVPP
jgi:hypothetical protein